MASLFVKRTETVVILNRSMVFNGDEEWRRLMRRPEDVSDFHWDIGDYRGFVREASINTKRRRWKGVAHLFMRIRMEAAMGLLDADTINIVTCERYGWFVLDLSKLFMFVSKPVTYENLEGLMETFQSKIDTKLDEDTLRVFLYGDTDDHRIAELGLKYQLELRAEIQRKSSVNFGLHKQNGI